MMNIPIKAQVDCTDRSCGKSTNVIVNPINQQVTHVVIHDKRLPENPTRIIPSGKVAEVTPQLITLNCTRAEVEEMPAFIVSNFVQESGSGQAYASGAAYYSKYVIDDTAYDEFQERNIPEGELALYSGMHVKAADGKVGKLDELVLDPDSGAITNLLMREGHLWGKKEVTIPLTAVDYADADTVYLTIDKEAIKALPTVNVKHPGDE